MTSDWRTVWSEVDRRHQEAKDSQGALEELFERYARLVSAERVAANQVLFESLDEDDETRRYDALAIINRFHLTEAIPHMRELAIRRHGCSSTTDLRAILSLSEPSAARSKAAR